MLLRKGLINSIIGFNGSKNCDKTNAKTFYNSYLKRQNRELRRRKRARIAGVLKPQNYYKVEFHQENIRDVENNKTQILEFMETFIDE